MMEEICQLKANKTKEKGSQHDPDLLKRGENVVTKPQGTFVPRWKDVQYDPEPDLRELLARKKKRKEAPAAELDEVPRCVRIRGLDGKIIYKL